MLALMDGARSGDAEVLERLRKGFDVDPDAWLAQSDLADVVGRVWVEVVAGTDPVAAQSLLRSAQKMRDDLVDGDPRPLIALLAERVVSAWLQVQRDDVAVATAPAS